MMQPGSIGNLVPVTDGDQEIWRHIRDIEKAIAEDRSARTLQAALIGAGGLTVQGGQIVIKDASGNVLLTLDGDGLTVSPGGVINVSGGNVQSGNFSAGSAGWRLQSNGNVEVNDLTLRGGIIGNDALESPLSVVTFADAANNLTFTTSFASYSTATVTVPTGYTKALISTTAFIRVSDGGSNSMGTALQGRVVISGTNSSSAINQSTEVATVTVPFARTITGLSGGGSVTSVVQAGFAPSGAAAASTGAVYQSGFVIFTR